MRKYESKQIKSKCQYIFYTQQIKIHYYEEIRVLVERILLNVCFVPEADVQLYI